MPSKVETTAFFDRKLERLGRRFPSVVDEVDSLITRLERDERPGDKVPKVGYDVYKVRLPNPSAGRGKSGGLRTIYYIRQADNVLLVTIYSKTEQADISPEEIRRIIEQHTK